MPAGYNFSFAGEQLVAFGDRTLWWPRGDCLFLADLHAGKAEHFRRAGVALPAGNLAADLARLHAAAIGTGASRVIVLGDLFHSDLNSEWDDLSAWIQRQPFAVELVRGNHDRFMSDTTLTAGGLVVHPEPLLLPPFELCHHPISVSAAAAPHHHRPVIAGHLHPVRRVRSAGGDQFRLPVFWLTANQIILPAFGSLTGGYQVPSRSTGTFLVCSPDFSTIIPY